MKGIIFKSVFARNFGPFKDEVKFDMDTVVPKSQVIENHTFLTNYEQQVNKVSYIYGANGSGKSNLCKIILQIQRAIMLSPLRASNNINLLELQPLKEDLSLPRNYFKFDSSCKEIATAYGIEMIIDGVTYNYSFSISENAEILSERLTKKKRRTEIILDRNSPEYGSIELKSELKSFQDNVRVVKNNALCLSMASFLNNKLATKIVDAITNISVVNMAAMRGLSNIDEDTFSDDKKEKYLKILKSADPTLRDIKVEFNEEKIEKRPFKLDDFENRAVVFRSVKVNVQSTHNVYNNKEIVNTSTLPFLQIESTGTIKLLNILPTIFDTLENGSVLFVDEIENGLHPYVVKLMLKLFYNPETNPYNAQLICTTHCTQLIDEAVQSPPDRR